MGNDSIIILNDQSLQKPYCNPVNHKRLIANEKNELNISIK